MKKRFWIVLILCMLGNACSIPYSSPFRASIASERARSQADVHAALALAYLDQGQMEVGRIEAQRALKRAPEHRDALHALALAALTQGDVAAARRHFEKAFNIEGDADDFALRLNYARFLCEHDDRAAGRTILERAPEQSPEHVLRMQRLLDGTCSRQVFF